MKDRKYRIFTIIQIGTKADRPSRAFDFILVAAIVLNILAQILRTFWSLNSLIVLFDVIIGITSVLFLAEYLLRIWTSEYLFPGMNRGKAMLKFIGSLDGIIELLTILPFYFLTGFVVFRLLRVVRILHLFQINSRYDSFSVIMTVLKEKRNQIMSSVFIILVMMLASALFMYGIEHNAQPDSFDNALSGIWWAMSTILTVGYGDIAPITILGRLFGIIIALLGVGLVAIPTGIISAGFMEHYTHMNNAARNIAGDTELVSLRIGLDSAWIGKTRHELEEEQKIIIALVQRDDVKFRPGDNYRVAMDDMLFIWDGNDN